MNTLIQLTKLQYGLRAYCICGRSKPLPIDKLIEHFGPDTILSKNQIKCSKCGRCAEALHLTLMR